MSSDGRLIGLRGMLALGSAGYVVARQAGVVDPASGPLDPVVETAGTLPGAAPIAVAAVVGLLGGFSLWLVLVALVRIPKALVRLHGSNGTSPMLIMLGVTGGVLLASVLVAGALLAADTGSLWGGDGVTGSADEVEDEDVPSLEDAQDLPSLEDISLDGDGVSLPGVSDTYSGCSEPTGADTDGDRLPDRWEEAGETPDGTPLPGADPDRKDIYVQPLYEEGAEQFTAREKRQLRRVWEQMPVSNPSGETGIALHFVAQAPDNQVDDAITVRNSLQQVRTQYYNEGTMGAGVCQYHLVAVGTVTGGSDVGKGEVPGYVTVVDSTRRPSYEGSVTLRVAITTHELLHNVAGRVGPGYHTDDGWLAPTVGPNSEFLGSEATAKLDDGFASP